VNRKPASSEKTGAEGNIIRLPAEQKCAEELARLEAQDHLARPPGWRLSPRMVETFIMGDRKLDISPKYVGDPALIQVAIATLASDRALLLVGDPGTAKSWLSEHLAAAICGTSQLVVQGTAGTTEDQIKYSWNYALLLAEGPSPRALVASPILTAMRAGHLARFEEVTRCASEVQDGLISLLSEKAVSIPELGCVEPAQRGFNIIATANTRDRGINEMSSALRRRFNFVELPVVSELQQEMDIVERRTKELMGEFDLQAEVPKETVETLVTVFQELRRGQTLDGSQKVKQPSTVMSTAEAISVLFAGCLLASHFGNGQVRGNELMRTLVGSVTKEDRADLEALADYLETVVKRRKGKVWSELYGLRGLVKK